MLTVSQLQWDQRWDTLPENIREYLYAPEAIEALEKILAEENLKEEAYAPLAKTTGYVLMGFLKPEAFAEELLAQLTLTPETAGRIAEKVGKEIFANFRNELAIIFSPPQDPSVIPQASKPAPEPAPFNPANSTFSSPVPPSVFPQAAVPPSASFPQASATPASAPSPASPLSSSAPAPTMMSAREEIRPIERGGVRFGFSDSRFKDAKPAAPAPRPAALEIGAKSPEAPAALAGTQRTDAIEPKVVHYSQWRNTSPAAPATMPTPAAFSPVPFSDLLKPGTLPGTNPMKNAAPATPQAPAPVVKPVPSAPPVKEAPKNAPPVIKAPDPITSPVQTPAPAVPPAATPAPAPVSIPESAPKPITFTSEDKKAGFLARFAPPGAVISEPTSRQDSPKTQNVTPNSAPASPSSATPVAPSAPQTPQIPPKNEASASDMIDLGSL